mgnify:FL=1|jgi:hypothetical protein
MKKVILVLSLLFLVSTCKKDEDSTSFNPMSYGKLQGNGLMGHCVKIESCYYMVRVFWVICNIMIPNLHKKTLYLGEIFMP